MNEQKRGAGILLHITSLPSRFGIGDLGPEAHRFAEFLQQGHQQYWQLLPLNPTEQGQAHSPYSSISSRAGNTLLISPELMVDDGLLDAKILEQHYLPEGDEIDYPSVEKSKALLFDLAWKAFHTGKSAHLLHDFDRFKKRESLWLNDFALYILLKEQNGGKPWFEWDESYKLKDEQTLSNLTSAHIDKIEKIKWLQFMFSRQWHALRKFCNEKNIKLFGDLPFYVSYDSVDVWSNRELFCLDEEGKMIGVAGVPPDAFSDEGQLWGMPVFLWDILKQQDYKWWIERFNKNMELFDLLRLDHFRAFADYWEVSADEKTAINGKWKPGPGADLFLQVEKELGKQAFIAEDLGEINDAVYELRDKFQFPGMKILQFAFGDTMPQSPYIPHNYNENFIAYTGTHDNNTIKGWYRQEGKQHHRQIDEYVGFRVNEDNVHLVMGRLAYSSVAKIAILPMQDVLGLDESARMNKPASGENNWLWRLMPGQVTDNTAELLRHWTWLYNRK